VGKFRVDTAGGAPYEVFIRPVGRMSQQRMDAAGVGNGPRAHMRSRDLNAEAKKKRMEAALKRTQGPRPGAVEQPGRVRESTGETPQRTVRQRLDGENIPVETGQLAEPPAMPGADAVMGNGGQEGLVERAMAAGLDLRGLVQPPA
jgi:hypothetical protein